MDEKTFTLTRTDRDLLFEVLASERTSLTRDLGAVRRRWNTGGPNREWDRVVLTAIEDRWSRVDALMRAFAAEEE